MEYVANKACAVRRCPANLIGDAALKGFLQPNQYCGTSTLRNGTRERQTGEDWKNNDRGVGVA
jgi:hypothetical protein